MNYNTKSRKLSVPLPLTSISFPESNMAEARDCVVKLVDDHGVEHSVRVRAESVYEAALKGLQKLERIGWESDGSQIGPNVCGPGCETPELKLGALRPRCTMYGSDRQLGRDLLTSI